jgi:hypothetical protein
VDQPPNSIVKLDEGTIVDERSHRSGHLCSRLGTPGENIKRIGLESRGTEVSWIKVVFVSLGGPTSCSTLARHPHYGRAQGASTYGQ